MRAGWPRRTNLPETLGINITLTMEEAFSRELDHYGAKFLPMDRGKATILIAVGKLCGVFKLSSRISVCLGLIKRTPWVCIMYALHPQRLASRLTFHKPGHYCVGVVPCSTLPCMHAYLYPSLLLPEYPISFLRHSDAGKSFRFFKVLLDLRLSTRAAAEIPSTPTD